MRSAHQLIWKVGSILLSVFIISFLISKIDYEALKSIVSQANLFWLILAIGITILYWGIFPVLRFMIVMRALGHRIKIMTAVKAVFVSSAVNIFLPSKLGDLSKAFVARRESSLSVGTSAVIADRISDMLVLILLAFVGAIFFSNIKYIIFLTGFFILLLLCILLSDYCEKLPFISHLCWGKICINGFSIWKRSWEKMLLSLLCSLGIWILTCVQIYLFYRAFNVNMHLFLVIMKFPLVVFFSLIPISFSGLGIREAAFAYFFRGYAPLSINVCVSLCYFLCAVCAPAIIGVMCILFLKKKKTRQ